MPFLFFQSQVIIHLLKENLHVFYFNKRFLKIECILIQKGIHIQLSKTYWSYMALFDML
jgi:hypothetical protein